MKFERRKHGPPPPHHHGHHHGRGHRSSADTLRSRIVRLQHMGATADDLHDVIDSELSELTGSISDHLKSIDPGRTSADAVVDPVTRAGILDTEFKRSSADFFNSLTEKTILIAGEFPPHIIEELINEINSRVIQVHPPTPHGDTPPHFDDFDGAGFVGVTNFEEIDEDHIDVVMFEAWPIAADFYVSPVVKIALRVFPNSQAAVLEVPHRAPHLRSRIAGDGLFRLPFLL